MATVSSLSMWDFIINGDQKIGVKCGLSLKIKKLQIHLYFIATKYKWKIAHVDYWTELDPIGV